MHNMDIYISEMAYSSCRDFCYKIEHVEKSFNTYSMAINYLCERSVMDYGEDWNNICI